MLKNVFKSDYEENDESMALRNYTYAIAGYLPATKRL